MAATATSKGWRAAVLNYRVRRWAGLCLASMISRMEAVAAVACSVCQACRSAQHAVRMCLPPRSVSSSHSLWSSDYSAAGHGRRADDELPRQQCGLHRRHPPRAAVPLRPVRSRPALTRGLRLPLLCQQAPNVIAGRHCPVICGNCRVGIRRGMRAFYRLKTVGRVQVPGRATVCGWLQHVSGPECTRLSYTRLLAKRCACARFPSVLPQGLVLYRGWPCAKQRFRANACLQSTAPVSCLCAADAGRASVRRGVFCCPGAG